MSTKMLTTVLIKKLTTMAKINPPVGWVTFS
ncbi:hypothetical protein BBOR36S_02329 [Brevibacillus borstelensis]